MFIRRCPETLSTPIRRGIVRTFLEGARVKLTAFRSEITDVTDLLGVYTLLLSGPREHHSAVEWIVLWMSFQNMIYSDINRRYHFEKIE